MVNNILLPINWQRKLILLNSSPNGKKAILALMAIIKGIKIIKYPNDFHFYLGSVNSLIKIWNKQKPGLYFPINDIGEAKIIIDSPDRELLLNLMEIKPIEILDHQQDYIIQKSNRVWVRANILPEYFLQLTRYSTGQCQVEQILATLEIIESCLLQTGVKIKTYPAVTIFTVDTEDQNNYFNNKKGECTDISGNRQNRQDMLFANCLDTAIRRFNRYGIKATFMITGSELRKRALDSFNQPMVNIKENWQYLKQGFDYQNHSIGLHAFDHQDWLKYGKSSHRPMRSFKKLIYFFNSGGTFPLLAKYILWVIRNFKTKEPLGLGGDLNKIRLSNQIDRLTKLFVSNQIPFVPLFRAPGFRRSEKLIEILNDRLISDSSELINIKYPVIPRPYYLLMSKNGRWQLSDVIEFPAIFIDEFIRSRRIRHSDSLIRYLDFVYQKQNAVITFISHTKVTGGDYGHCHIYHRNPLSGLSQSPTKASLKKIYKFIEEKGSSLDFQRFLDEKRYNN